MSMFSRWFSLWHTSECCYSIGRARTVVNMFIKACLYTHWYPALHRAKQTHLIDQTPDQIWYDTQNPVHSWYIFHCTTWWFGGSKGAVRYGYCIHSIPHFNSEQRTIQDFPMESQISRKKTWNRPSYKPIKTFMFPMKIDDFPKCQVAISHPASWRPSLAMAARRLPSPTRSSGSLVDKTRVVWDQPTWISMEL